MKYDERPRPISETAIAALVAVVATLGAFLAIVLGATTH